MASVCRSKAIPISRSWTVLHRQLLDHVRCFACDGGLRRWDPEDDPWIEHCKWFPACPYARGQKGDEYIALAQASMETDLLYKYREQKSTSNPNTQLEARTENMTINSPANEELRGTCTREMGFLNEDFDKAISDEKENIRPTIEDVIEVLSKRQRNPPANQRSHRENLIEKNKRLRSMLLCIICQRNQVNALYLPCTHHRLCMDCIREYSTTCPVCQRPVDEIIKTFFNQLSFTKNTNTNSAAQDSQYTFHGGLKNIAGNIHGGTFNINIQAIPSKASPSSSACCDTPFTPRKRRRIIIESDSE